MPKPPSSAAKRPVIFLHIPKAGGSTLRRLLHKQYPSKSVYRIESDINGDILRFGELTFEQTQKIQLVTGHQAFGLHTYLPDAVYITMLREPITRVISEYRFIANNPYHVLYDSVSKMSLLAYLDCGLSGQISNGQTRLIAGIWKDQQCGVPGNRDVTAKDLEQAKHNLAEHFIYPGTLAYYDEVLLLWRQALGWKMPVYLRENVTPVPYSPPNAKELALIRELNQWDLQLYDWVQKELTQTINQRGARFRAQVAGFRQLNWCYGKSVATRRRLAALTASQ